MAAEVIVSFTEPTKAPNGDLYYARALGRQGTDGLWEGWLEFILAGSDEIVTTRKETVQPNRTDLKYWAQGLTGVYLEGALDRGMHPAPARLSGEKRLYVDSSPTAPPEA